MKYIRTKGGIYETIDYDQLPNNLKKQLDEREHSCMKDYKKMGVFAKMKKSALIISNIQPILLFAIQKQADTIEELCDAVIWQCMVFDRIENNCLIDTSYEELETSIDEEMIHQGIYGAIWTDKGLIYAAKMNDKGELELL